jgi:hypothetical protein
MITYIQEVDSKKYLQTDLNNKQLINKNISLCM